MVDTRSVTPLCLRGRSSRPPIDEDQPHPPPVLCSGLPSPGHEEPVTPSGRIVTDRVSSRRYIKTIYLCAVYLLLCLLHSPRLTRPPSPVRIRYVLGLFRGTSTTVTSTGTSYRFLPLHLCRKDRFGCHGLLYRHRLQSEQTSASLSRTDRPRTPFTPLPTGVAVPKQWAQPTYIRMRPSKSPFSGLMLFGS